MKTIAYAEHATTRRVIDPQSFIRVSSHTGVGAEGAKPAVATQDLRDLLAAAGPLTPDDIAGGLNAPIAAVMRTIGALVQRGETREDEFGRYSLRAA